MCGAETIFDRHGFLHGKVRLREKRGHGARWCAKAAWESGQRQVVGREQGHPMTRGGGAAGAERMGRDMESTEEMMDGKSYHRHG